MRRIALLALVIGILSPFLASAPAHAQATRTWVSGVGDDANPCSRTAPCKTFAGAISKTAAGGEINCLDPGGFGGVTITKAISISCEAGTAGVLVSGTNAIVINALATDEIFLKGLDIEGLGTGLNGIKVLSAGLLQVEDCVIRGFNAGAPNGLAIQIVPSVNMKFVVTRTSIFNNGAGGTGGGIQIRPTGGAITGVIDRVVANRNAFGIAADGTGGALGINITVRDSTINGNTATGILATTNSTGTGIMVANTAIANNAVGVQSAGAAAVLRIGQSQITGNGTGVSGPVLSYGNNQLNGNGTDGSLSAVPGGLH
jgi:hypothetical protein